MKKRKKRWSEDGEGHFRERQREREREREQQALLVYFVVENRKQPPFFGAIPKEFKKRKKRKKCEEKQEENEENCGNATLFFFFLCLFDIWKIHSLAHIF